MMKEIILYKERVCLVDNEDYDFLNQWKWSFDGRYVYRKKFLDKEYKKYNKIYIHRLIMNTPKGLDTDHIDGNKLNNQRGNLRVATRAENSSNKVGALNKVSKYKGVSWHKQRGYWKAEISYRKKRRHLGIFQSETEAAKAYDIAAKNYHLEYAKLNFN